MTNQRAANGRHLIGALAFVGLSCIAQPVGTLPSELEPYFNAIRMVESRNHPWSIFDNTTRQSHRLNTRAEAEAKAAELIKYGHNVDLGLMQLNCRYQCSRPGVGLANIFDPEINVNTAKIIFMEFWEQARRISTEFNARIVAAVGAYNNGRVGTPNVSYVQKVWQQMGKAVDTLPDAGSGRPEQAAGNRGMMDEALGRASKGMDWARERLAAMSKPKEPQQAQAQPPENTRETTTILGGLGLATAGIVIGLAMYFLGPVLLPAFKLFGGKKAVAKAAVRYANNRRKQTQEQMNG
ncbi:transglycosylase SLT domain-containing protein [Curvibacter sp. APW13]|uniref:transglycosylase SLT domain-containing protein n=1 Tax=Curvibacter sp. APW13 TaxID=3077236 RepID=UPI0028DE475E|nr:transglycosylase SLT domain-containing protein [Curvibacter sp. APW13]MDT8992884.1 transglycosylase SLT domain-containing protein [Curvibacter sp. APW13]